MCARCVREVQWVQDVSVAREVLMGARCVRSQGGSMGARCVSG